MIKKGNRMPGAINFLLSVEQKKISQHRNNRSCLNKPRNYLSKKKYSIEGENVNQKILNIEWKNYFYMPLLVSLPMKKT